jgi:hypothetical protein
MKLQERRLEDLVAIGPAMMRDLKSLRIRSVDQLAQQNPRKMDRDLCRLKGPPGYLLSGCLYCRGGPGEKPGTARRATIDGQVTTELERRQARRLGAISLAQLSLMNFRAHSQSVALSCFFQEKLESVSAQ